MRFIGDVHGKYKQYKRLIKDVPASIQVGDMGVGFRRLIDNSFHVNPPHYAMTQGNHRFIRGNHDNPFECYKHSQFIHDGTVENGMMFVGGAHSIDRHLRHEGYDWWTDEELSHEKLWAVMDVYDEAKPNIMITHDCPISLYSMVGTSRKHDEVGSRTSQAFQSMFERHQPNIWIFGHHHKSSRNVVNGCEFICLAELEHLDMEI